MVVSDGFLRTQATAGVKWTAAAAGGAALLQVFQIAVLTRILTPVDFGLIAFVTIFVGLAQIFADMGLTNAVVVKKYPTQEQLSSLYWLNLLAGGVLFVLFMGLAPCVAAFYQEPGLRRLLIWSALAFLIAPFGQLFHILLQKNLRFDTVAKVEFAGTLTGTLVTVCSALLGQGVYSFVWGQLANTALRSAGFASVGGKTWWPSRHFHRNDLGGYFSFGLYQLGERVVNFISWNLDKLLIGSVLGTESLGIYNVAYQLMMRPRSMLAPVITRVTLPIFSKLEDDARLRAGYLQVIEVVSFLSIPLFVFMFAASGPLLSVLVGPGWEKTTATFRILVWLGILYSLGNPTGSLVLSKGRADVGFWFNVLGLCTYFLSALVGSLWGVTGVAWGLLVATCVVLVPAEFVIRRSLVALTAGEYLGRVLPFFGLSLVAAFCMVSSDALLGVRSTPVRLGVMVTVCLLVYVGCVVLLKKDFLMRMRQK